MQPHDLALDLLALAESDECAAHVLLGDARVDDAIVAFHYQQAAEKLLKALLAEKGVDFPRTYDLVRLTEMVEDAGYQLPASLAELDTLNPFAVTFRYEKDALVVNKEQAGNLMEQLREWVEAQVTGQPAHAAEESEHG